MKKETSCDSDDEYDLVESRESHPGPARPRETMKPNDTHTDLPAVPISAFSKSVSIADLLKACKLVQPLDESEVLLTLEAFDIVKSKWDKLKPSWFTKEHKKFVEGGFRDAFLA